MKTINPTTQGLTLVVQLASSSFCRDEVRDEVSHFDSMDVSSAVQQGKQMHRQRLIIQRLSDSNLHPPHRFNRCDKPSGCGHRKSEHSNARLC